jgi:hypothetical protein
VIGAQQCEPSSVSPAIWLSDSSQMRE